MRIVFVTLLALTLLGGTLGFCIGAPAISLSVLSVGLIVCLGAYLMSLDDEGCDPTHPSIHE